MGVTPSTFWKYRCIWRQRTDTFVWPVRRSATPSATFSSAVAGRARSARSCAVTGRAEADAVVARMPARASTARIEPERTALRIGKCRGIRDRRPTGESLAHVDGGIAVDEALAGEERDLFRGAERDDGIRVERAQGR